MGFIFVLVPILFLAGFFGLLKREFDWYFNGYIATHKFVFFVLLYLMMILICLFHFIPLGIKVMNMTHP